MAFDCDVMVLLPVEPVVVLKVSHWHIAAHCRLILCAFRRVVVVVAAVLVGYLSCRGNR